MRYRIFGHIMWMSLLVLTTVGFAADKLRAGFIYVGPIGDYGWTHAHNQAREIADKTFPWLETTYVESVPEGEVGVFIDRMVQQGAKRHPNVIFAHATGFKRAPNLATYHADFYQVYYLNGLIAGALSKSGRIGYVGAFPIPEVKRHISAFTIGAREVNPKAEVHVRWINAWFNPAAAKEAAEALIADGADVFAFTEDTPTVIQVAAKRQLPSFAHYSPMYQFAPKYVVSGQLVHWEKIYLDFLGKIHDGTYSAKNLAEVDYWSLLSDQSVSLGAKTGMPINPAYKEALSAIKVKDDALGEVSVYELVEKRLAQMTQPTPAFDPFTGPLQDRKGNTRVPDGERLAQQELVRMEWAVTGIAGPWPNEPQ